MRRRSSYTEPSYTEPDCCFAGVGDVEIQKTKKKILLISLRTLEETAVVEWDIGSGRKYGTNAVLHDWSLPMEFFALKMMEDLYQELEILDEPLVGKFPFKS